MAGQALRGILQPAAVESERIVKRKPGGERRTRREAAMDGGGAQLCAAEGLIVMGFCLTRQA